MKGLADFLDREIDLRLPEDRKNSKLPIGYITDDQEFVCSIAHSLVSINGIPLDPAPLISDSVHESYLESADTDSRFEEIERDHQFSWVELLGAVARSKLGIPENHVHDSASLSLKMRQQHLSAQELEWHYQRGILDSANSDTARIVSIQLGAGPWWDPACGQESCQDGGSKDFPDDCPPTHELRISACKLVSTGDLVLLRILELLAGIIRNNISDLRL